LLEKPKKEDNKQHVPMSFNTTQPQKPRPNIPFSQEKKPENKPTFAPRPQQSNRPAPSRPPQH